MSLILNGTSGLFGNVTGGDISGNFIGLNGDASSTTALATGSTTARSLANRFADVANVLDFGAFNNNTNASATRIAIQAAIDNSLGRSIYFPPGIYAIDNTININRNDVELFCDASGSAIITLTNLSSSCAIRIQNPTLGDKVYKPVIQNLTITRSSGSTYAIGIDAEEAQDLRITEVEMYGFATCLNLKGCFNCFYSNLRLSSFGSTNTDSKKGTIQFSETTLSTPPFEGYTHLFTNCHIVGSRYPIYIKGTDYISFNNCYVAAGIEGGVLIEPDATQTIGNYNNNFDNIYFDRASQSTDLYAITITDITIPPPADAAGTKITDCVFTGWEKHIYINKTFDPHIEISGCRFSGAAGSAIDVTGNYTNLLITGNQFYSNTYKIAGTSTIDIKDVHSSAITGNVFSLQYKADPPLPAPPYYPGSRNMIRLAGTIDALTITGNAIQNDSGTTITDLANTATIGNFVVTGNASDNATNTIGGSIIGNKLNSNSLALDWYQEGFFVPSLSFGGLSTGIVYNGSPSGHYTRIGNRVFFDIYIALSNKGSATGNCEIGTFPYPKSGSNVPVMNINLGGFDAAIGTTNLEASMPTSTTVTLLKYASGSTTRLTEADFTNTSFFSISGTYFV